MRWRFPDPNDTHEAARRAHLLTKIDSFWRELARALPAIEATLEKRGSFDLAAFFATHLQAIDPDITWELGPGIEGKKRRLVLSAERARHLRPLVEQLLARAPGFLDLAVVGHRPPEGWENALLVSRGLVGRDLRGATVECVRGPLHFVDVKWTLPGSATANEDWQSAAFLATRTLAGEAAVDEWIGDISVEDGPGLLGRFFHRPIATNDPATLRERVGGVVEEIRAGLFAQPHGVLGDYGAGAVLKRKRPEEAPDYAGRRDVYVGVSRGFEEQWRAAHTPVPFSSTRFSKHGETFCYLKLDGSVGLDATKWKDRGEIEDELDAMLRSTGLGSVVGGATGIRYSYVDLALLRLDDAIPQIVRLLREGRMMERSWILFFDSCWRDEWIGVHERTPPPPMDS